MAIEEKDRDDVMDRLLQLGGDKKFLSYDDLNRELPENVVSPDDIEDVLQKLDASNIHVADSTDPRRRSRDRQTHRTRPDQNSKGHCSIADRSGRITQNRRGTRRR